LEGIRDHFHLCRFISEALCLYRAQVPGADKGPLDPIQSAAVRIIIAAVVSLLVQQLLIGHRDAGEVEKEEVFEIGPHPCPLAAHVRAVWTGPPAQAVHKGKHQFKKAAYLVGLPVGFSKHHLVLPYGIR
jgi:hypothetical protein